MTPSPHRSARRPGRPHVLVVMPLAERRGGSELALMQLMGEVRDSTTRWSVLFLEDGPMLRELQAEGIATYLIEAGRFRQPCRVVETIWRIRCLVRRLDVGLIFGWAGKAHLYGGLAALTCGIPAMWFQHNIPDRGLQNRLATLIPATRVLACSRFVAERQARIRPRRETRVVYPGVDLRRFDPKALPQPRELRSAFGISPEAPVVGMVGRLQRWKGFHHLIEAMPAVLRQRPDANFMIVGGAHKLEPDYANHLEEMVERNGLKEKVVLAGFQPNVPEWMQMMDVVVHGSDHEPFGMVIVEAMALGKSVVASDTGGPREIITAGRDGLLCRSDDPAALASAILKLLDGMTLRTHIGEEARRRAHDFSLSTFARAIEAEVLHAHRDERDARQRV